MFDSKTGENAINSVKKKKKTAKLITYKKPHPDIKEKVPSKLTIAIEVLLKGILSIACHN
jgi:hypothetical protein